MTAGTRSTITMFAIVLLFGGALAIWWHSNCRGLFVEDCSEDRMPFAVFGWAAVGVGLFIGFWAWADGWAQAQRAKAEQGTEKP